MRLRKTFASAPPAATVRAYFSSPHHRSPPCQNEGLPIVSSMRVASRGADLKIEARKIAYRFVGDHPATRKAGEKLSFGRAQTPQETAYAVIYLLSDESAQVTGTTMHLDAGASTLPIQPGTYPG